MSTSPNKVCFSGGAEGADTLFGECAEAAGHRVIHYSFAGHRRIEKHAHVLTQTELEIADPLLTLVNRTVLKRTFPARSEHTNNLLRRNFWQIKDTEAVFAVTNLDHGRQVLGGTAWAVYMAIERGVDVYVFDMVTSKWNQWSYISRGWLPFDTFETTLPSRYTGIGSRALSPEGIAAIKALYN